MVQVSDIHWQHDSKQALLMLYKFKNSRRLEAQSIVLRGLPKSDPNTCAVRDLR